MRGLLVLCVLGEYVWGDIGFSKGWGNVFVVIYNSSGGWRLGERGERDILTVREGM